MHSQTTPKTRARAATVLLAVSLATLGVAFTAARATADQKSGQQAQTAAAAAAAAAANVQHESHTTNRFAGPKANRGTATLVNHDGKRTLTWSDDFLIPNTPAPHWQVIDSSGNAYLLQRLIVKGDKQNRTIEVPAYVKDVAKVRIWCAYAEVVLGEASFASPVN